MPELVEVLTVHSRTKRSSGVTAGAAPRALQSVTAENLVLSSLLYPLVTRRGFLPRESGTTVFGRKKDASAARGRP